MTWNQDAELQKVFRDEVSERAGRLAAAARSMVDGAPTAEEAKAMLRDGHALKGTAKMMGFEAIAEAGRALEDAWRRVERDELDPSPGLAAALEALSMELLPTLEADPERGTPGLSGAVSRVETACREDLNESAAEAESSDPGGNTVAPDTSGASEEQVTTVPASSDLAASTATDSDSLRVAVEPSDLGGLLGALEIWAADEVVQVNAASLYRLINGVCTLRIGAEAMGDMVEELSGAVDGSAEIADYASSLSESVKAAGKAVAELQLQALRLASAQLHEVTNTFPQLVRYLARKSGKEIRFELVGDDASLDRQVLERISEPLRYLLVNAVEHGIESPAEREEAGKSRTGTVSLHVTVNGNRLEVVVEDDGRGVDWSAVHRSAVRQALLPQDPEPDQERLRRILFEPGFSTVAKGELVGTGDGLATVAAAVEALYGTLTFETQPDAGTRVAIAVPTSRALQDVILVRAASQMWGIPEIAVVESLPADDARTLMTTRKNQMSWRGRDIPVASFAGAVGVLEKEAATWALIVSGPAGPAAVTVPQLIGRRQVAAKELGPLLDGVPHLTGAALLGGGDVVVLVDPGRLVERARAFRPVSGPRPRVLVVDDSKGVRQVVAGALSSDGFEVAVARDAEEALAILAGRGFDAIVVDFDLPTIDGVGLIQEVRMRHGNLPIVMLSAVATSEDQGRAVAAGADAYFDKGDVRKGALAAVLKELVTAPVGDTP
ncbi:MAG: response regulator [Acidimicrobiia bacterium]